jgi:class 3 adenylate cyclase
MLPTGERSMPYFMDRHDQPGITATEIAMAHAQDLAIQDKYGVRFLSYWFDPVRESTFCLAEAGSRESCSAVHAASHGQTPSQIIPVDRATVELFLGRVVDPATTGVSLPAFRVIMFTDMVGSTDATQRLGDDASMAVLRTHNGIVRNQLQEHRGREVKHTGDGFMASFESVTDSLSCAGGIQRAIRDHNRESDDPDARFQVRIGGAAGEPVEEGNDLFGASVQLAARLCGNAAPMQVLVTEAISELAVGKRFRFGPAKDLVMKGFDRPVRAVDLLWDGEE